MSTFFPRYTAAIADFDKTKALFPANQLAPLKKGAGMGVALRAFDKVARVEERRKAMIVVRTTEQIYEKEIANLMKIVKKQDSPAYKALVKLQKNLRAILTDADEAAEPPKPGSGTVPYEVLRSFNLGNGFKSKYLDVQATKVDVAIDVDKTLDGLIKSGQESLKIAHLGDVAKEEVKKIGDAFSETLKALDGKIEGLDAAGRKLKITEANEVLKHYAKIVEDRVNAAIAKEWQEYLARRQYLKDFRFQCGVKVALGVVGAGVAAASMAMTFGALWQSVIGLAKSILSIAEVIKTFSQNIDQVYELLIKDMHAVTELNAQREAARKNAQSQAKSKGKEMAKEVAVAVLPITKNVIRSATSVQARAKQFLGLVSKLEDMADKLSGQLNKAIAVMAKLPDKHGNTVMEKDIDNMNETFQRLFQEINELHARSQNAAKFGQRSLAEVQKLLKEDSWSEPAETATNLGSRGFTVYSLANFVFETAKHGATLVSLL